MSGLFHADNLILCSESEEDLRVIIELFEVCKRSGLKVNGNKSKGMMSGGRKARYMRSASMGVS